MVFIPLLFLVTLPIADPQHTVHEWYHWEGPLAGSLRSEAPLPIFDDNPQHVLNRLFKTLYVRRSRFTVDGTANERIEGGDEIDFLAWGGSSYWSTATTRQRASDILDEFLGSNAVDKLDDMQRVVLLRDLWAVFDHYTNQNMRRVGSIEVRRGRTALCQKLARVIQRLAVPNADIVALPDNYRDAVQSGAFAHARTVERAYLPPGMLRGENGWVEIDFFQPDLHEDLFDRFITLHTRNYVGRSYFRVFYRFPGGRAQLSAYLQSLESDGIDWKQAAQDGFILLKKDAPQIPAGTEVALVQFAMTLDDKLQPTPTRLVESVRHRWYRNLDGSKTPATNTGVGMHVSEFTLKRFLLFKGVQGGLVREPDDVPRYRVIFQPAAAPDWGTAGRIVLKKQCVSCHMTPRATRRGVHSIPSIVHMGGFDAGAQLGIAHPLPANKGNARGKRAARWKRQHETYRRLLEALEL